MPARGIPAPPARSLVNLIAFFPALPARRAPVAQIQ
jgi:hypothetical protein